MDDTALALIAEHSLAGSLLRQEFFAGWAERLRDAAFRAALCLARGGKILLCGNGGSAADAQHLAAEFVNRFLMDRPALPAVALSTDTSILTAIGNDLDFNQIFARQVEALGRKDDMLVAISTSGNSANVLAALHTAREAGLTTVGLSGHGGGEMARLCHILLDVPSARTPLIQEVHIAAGHLLCQLVDHYLFENPSALAPHLAPVQNHRE